MSTRVQKGSTVFRPVARPRAHGSESRQSSAVPDSRLSVGPSSVQHDPVPPNGTTSMPPPSTIPSKSPLVVAQTPEVTRAPPTVVSVASSNRENARPVLANGASMILPPSRNSRPPVQIASPSRMPTSTPLRQVIHNAEPSSSTALRQAAPDTEFSASAPNQQTSVDLEYAIDNATAVAALTQLAAALEGSRQVQPTAESAGSDKPKRKRQIRKSTGDVSESGEEQSSQQPATRRRKSKPSSNPRRSRTRQPSVPPFDPNADPGEELDPTVITMAMLCDDTGQGRVSTKASQIVSNHAAWRASNKEKRARMRTQMEAKKYGRDADEEQPTARRANEESAQRELAPPIKSTGYPVAGPSTSGPIVPDGAPAPPDGFNYAENLATSRYAVRVRIGPNGETIIDEDSLFVNRHEEQDTEGYTHIEESDTTKFVNSGTYGKKLRGSRWSAEETELFYDALSQFGENYELISYVLPGRDRKACKNKFKAEDKKNPNRITYCLNNRRPYDIQTLSRMTGKDFSGPTPVIRAPTPARLNDQDNEGAAGTGEAADANEKPETNAEEIVGNIDSDEELPNSLFGE